MQTGQGDARGKREMENVSKTGEARKMQRKKARRKEEKGLERF